MIKSVQILDADGHNVCDLELQDGWEVKLFDENGYELNTLNTNDDKEDIRTPGFAPQPAYVGSYNSPTYGQPARPQAFSGFFGSPQYNQDTDD